MLLANLELANKSKLESIGKTQISHKSLIALANKRKEALVNLPVEECLFTMIDDDCGDDEVAVSSPAPCQSIDCSRHAGWRQIRIAQADLQIFDLILKYRALRKQKVALKALILKRRSIVVKVAVEPGLVTDPTVTVKVEAPVAIAVAATPVHDLSTTHLPLDIKMDETGSPGIIASSPATEDLVVDDIPQTDDISIAIEKRKEIKIEDVSVELYTTTLKSEEVSL